MNNEIEQAFLEIFSERIGGSQLENELKYLSDTELLLRLTSKDIEEDCVGLLKAPWQYFMKYRIDRDDVFISDISEESITLALKILLWSNRSPKMLINIFLGGGVEWKTVIF